MIVIPQAFVLTEAATATPLTHPRIGYQTWLRDLLASAVTVSTEDDDGPKDAPLRPDTAEYWQPTALPATWEVDLGAARAIDYVGVAGHTLGTAGASIKVETSDGSLAGSPEEQVWTTFASELLPSDDAPLLFLDDEVSQRYLRLTLAAGGGGDGSMPKIAVVYAGQVLKMSRPIYGGHGPMTLSRETVLHRSLSRGGQFLGQGFRRHGVVGSAAFRHLTSSFYRASFDPFVKAARQYPFFFGWRPADFPLEIAYAWCPDDIRPSNMGIRDFMQVSFNMHGIGHE